MKRSRIVQAFLVVSAAGALSSCGQRHEAERRCVDENGSFSVAGNCAGGGIAGTAGHHYAWVYAPAGASNKSPDDMSATSSKSPSSEGTSRGVVGAEGAAHAGGEGSHAGGSAGGAGE